MKFSRSIPAVAKPAFDFETTHEPCRGWCMWKDGKPYDSPCKTKRRLLIGYDLMPLMGLSRMERYLAKKGITPHRCQVVSDPSSTLFAVAHGGAIQRESVEWSTFCQYETKQTRIAQSSFSSACGYVRHREEPKKSDREADPQIVKLGRYAWVLSSDADRWMPTDKRRISTHRRLISDCAQILRSLGYSIVPVSVVPA
ncbi:MAG: hypothetical protein AAF989_10510 [Planctomycetota bacterium]